MKIKLEIEIDTEKDSEEIVNLIGLATIIDGRAGIGQSTRAYDLSRGSHGGHRRRGSLAAQQSTAQRQTW